MRRLHFSRRHGLACLLLLATTLLCGHPSVQGDFVLYDDPEWLSENPLFLPFDRGSLAEVWTTTDRSGIYTPLAWTVAGWLSLRAHGADGLALDPFPFHLAGLLWHALAGLACYLFLHLWTRELAGERFPLLPLAGSLLFVAHPLQTQSYCWTTGMNIPLGTIFALLALSGWLVFLQRSRGGRRPARSWLPIYLLALFALVAALLCRPSNLALPLIAALGGILIGGTGLRLLATALAPWILGCLVVVALTLHFQPPGNPELLGNDGLQLASGLRASGFGVLFGLGKLLWPLPLVMDYGITPREIDALSWRWLLPLIYPSLLIGIALLWWRSLRLECFLLAVAALWFLPVSGLFLIESRTGFSLVSDRYYYQADLGLLALLAVAVFRWIPDRAAPVILGVLVVLVGALTLRQTRVWSDTETLARHSVDHVPTGWFSHLLLGEELARQGRLEEALPILGKAAEIAGTEGIVRWKASSALAKLHARRNERELARRLLEPLLENPFARGSAQAELGLLELSQGRVAAAEKLLSGSVGEPWGKENASTWINLGVARQTLGNHRGAETAFEEAIRLQPNLPQPHYNLAIAIYQNQGDLNRALHHLEEACRLDPGNTEWPILREELRGMLSP